MTDVTDHIRLTGQFYMALVSLVRVVYLLELVLFFPEPTQELDLSYSDEITGDSHMIVSVKFGE